MQVGSVRAVDLDKEHGARHTSFINEAPASYRETPPPSLGRRVQAIIDEAWRRARRRRIGILIGLGLVSALVALLLLRDNTQSATEPGGTSSPATAVAASSVVRGTPSMGVACSTPNALSCDRVGMQVRLEDPAALVTATLAGMSFPLDNSDWGPDPGKRPVKRFTGYLEHAGLRTPGQPHVLEKSNGRYHWLESTAAKLPVTLRIERDDGTIQTTQVRVWLAGGWG